ncbi:TonB-dependent receptor [soil metagenome]
MIKRTALLAGTASCLLAHPATAQTALPTAPAPAFESAAAPGQATTGVLVYDPAFFASSSPNTAYDMIQRLPGFGLDTGDSSARGLASSAGNVLIDGNRPSSKTDNLYEILRRIPASGVARIELIRGGAPGIDMQGRSVIANVILKKTSTSELAAEANVYLYPDGYLGPQLKLQYSKQEGDRQTEAALFATTDRTGGTADGTRVRRDPSGAVIQSADLDLRDRFQTVNGRGTIQRPVWGGKLRVNGLLDYNGVKESQTVTIRSGEGYGERNSDDNRTISGELGANWTRALGPRSEVEITGLQRSSFYRYDSDSANGGGASPFGIDSTSGESIGRAVWKFRPSAKWAVESGGEIAYNYLDSNTDYTQGGVAIALPNASVLVSELRGEAFGQITFRPSPKLTLEAGLRLEESRISQSGDTDLSRSFFYPKPRAQLTWLPADHHQIRLRVEEEVGQLDFGDFSASTEINLGTVAGGNAELVPQRDLVFEAVYEFRFWSKGVFALTAQHNELRDVIDFIPLVGGFDAVGNIGNGTQEYLQARITLPLDKIGMKNALLSARTSFFWSSVTDPLTRERRRLPAEQAFGCGVSFSQDLKGGRFSYGAEHGCNVDRGTKYRVREVRTLAAQPYVSLYAQWKPRKDLTIRFDLGNVTDATQANIREIHSGPRNTTPIAYREYRATQQGRYAFLQIRKVL